MTAVFVFFLCSRRSGRLSPPRRCPTRSGSKPLRHRIQRDASLLHSPKQRAVLAPPELILKQFAVARPLLLPRVDALTGQAGKRYNLMSYKTPNARRCSADSVRQTESRTKISLLFRAHRPKNTRGKLGPFRVRPQRTAQLPQTGINHGQHLDGRRR